MALLELHGIGKRYGKLVANKDINLELGEGEARGIIGANGAGKTTLLSIISGHQRASSGRIYFDGIDISGYGVSRRANMGIGRKFQTPAVFPNLSVVDNIMIAGIGARGGRKMRDDELDEVLADVRLADHKTKKAIHLSHGQRQWLEIGLLLANRSRLLLLDEPAAGMTEHEASATVDLIKRLVKDRGKSVLVIEHNMRFIEALDTRITVMDLGEVIAEGLYAEIAMRQDVRAAYLGTVDETHGA